MLMVCEGSYARHQKLFLGRVALQRCQLGGLTGLGFSPLRCGSVALDGLLRPHSRAAVQFNSALGQRIMAMDTQVSVVVGASRGIGLELAKLLLSGGHVFATCRKESDTLSDIAAQNSAFHVVPGVDVESTEGCAPLATLPSKIDLAVLNAGVLTNDDFSSINFSDCAWQFNTNALGPLRCMQELLPKLTEGSKVIIIGSKLGSFGETVPGRRFGYRMSKCAVHMAARCLAEELRAQGILVAVVHPGVVETDMVAVAGSKAEVSAEDSAAGIAEVVAGLTMEDTGSFHNYLGQRLAW